MADLTPGTIAAVVAALRAVDDASGPSPSQGGDPMAWYRLRRTALAQAGTRLTEQLGARIRPRWNGGHVKIAGLAASSTSRLDGALQNWLTAARKRVSCS